MICLVCRQAETINGLTSVIFERGEIKIVIDHVPGYICPSCGEAYVKEDIAVTLLHTAEEKSNAGELQAVVDYELL